MQRVKDWLKEAEAELKAAEDLFKTKHWSWCCFTCQQSAKKSLKAICEYFRTPQFGHNLNILLQAIKTHTEVDKTLEQACASLNHYYIPTRYPNAFDMGAPSDQFFEEDAYNALDNAKKVLRYAQNIIKSSSDEER
jgi:HEPN domain-containing protein